MQADHDATYLHKVASAPTRESDPLRDTMPAEAVPPPKNVLPGELVTSEEDAPSAEDAFSDEDTAAGQDTLAGQDTVAWPGTPPEPGLEPEPEYDPAPASSAEQSLLAGAAATRQRWMSLQASFVDDPRVAVTEGAALVADVLAQLQAAVRNAQLDGDTETLRLQMRRYRLLLDRLTGL